MRRRIGALMVLLALATTACAGGDGGEATDASPSVASSPADDGGNNGGDGDGGDGGDLEQPLPESGGGPQATLAGLPIGGSEFVLVDDAWCGEAFLQTSPPDGVRVGITGVSPDTAGATVVDRRCGGTPCVAAVLESGGLSSCTVAVLPPTADTASVDVTIDAVAWCSTQAECDAYQASSGQQVWTMCHPQNGCEPVTDAPTEPTEPTEPTDPATTDAPTEPPTDEEPDAESSP